MTTTVCTWEVLPSDSRFPIIACGMSSDPDKARRDVEQAMTRPGAGIGQLVRLPVHGLRPGPGESGIWPPLGQIQQCRYDRHGRYSWSPYPAYGSGPIAPVSAKPGGRHAHAGRAAPVGSPPRRPLGVTHRGAADSSVHVDRCARRAAKSGKTS
jgi:hypothetical protein